MAESPDLDFRPEYGLLIAEVQCPSTPGPQLIIKSPELSTSSSSEETELARGDGSQSPPPNCAICLGRCKNKCFTNSCMHQFCFKCLLEWSKVKPECPLCKQTFKAIIHNVKSMDQFEEYLVQQPVSASPVPDVYSPFPIPAHLYPQLPTNINGRMHLYMDNSAMNTLDLTGIQFHSSPNTSRDAYRSYDRRVMPDAAQLLDMYSQETIQGETGSGSLSQLWRRYVYDRKLYALPMPDITGRLRESSARFYRDNPSQVHRLMPWINRDIVCLLRNTDHDVSAVMEQINNMLLTCNILSPEFRRRLIPFLGTKTLHFIHELNNFARSPFDMNGYDRVVQYSTNSSDEIVIEFSSTSSAGSDVESVNNDTQQEASTSRRVNRQTTATNTGSSGGGFNLYTTSSMTSLLQASAINLSTHNRGVNGDNSEGTATTSTVELVSAPTAERPTNIVLSSTSSDECEFVLEQKPPHLRTPELVSLNSESDSDVIFVQETKTTPMPSGITKWASTNSTRVRRPQRRRTNPSVNVQSFSTSNSDTDTFQYNEATSPKKMKIDNWLEVDVGKETLAGTSAADPKSSNDDVTNVMAKVKEEFNQGASTSTGLQSRYRGTRPNIPRVRHYRQHFTATSDSDDMNDSDSSSTASYFTTDASHSPSDSDTSWSKSRRNSNKQSLKRSRQQKVNTTSSSRKSRRQLNSSSKSKRTKSSKSPSAKASCTGRKKKAAKRIRRKSPKSKTSRRNRRAASPKDYATSEEDEVAPDIKEEIHEPPPIPMGICYPCNYSSPASNDDDDDEGEEEEEEEEDEEEEEVEEEDESNKETTKQSRSSTFSSTSSSSTSDSSDTTEETPCISPTSTVEAATHTNSNPPAAGEQMADSTASMQSLPPPAEAVNNPNANMAIYSDTD